MRHTRQLREAQNAAFALLGLYSACHADWITFASLDQTPSLVNHPNNTNQFGMFSCTVEYSPIYCRASLQRLRSTVTPLSPYLFFSETKLVFLACLIKIKVQIFRIKLDALTKHEAVEQNTSLLEHRNNQPNAAVAGNQEDILFSVAALDNESP